MSKAEEQFALQVRAVGLPEPEREYRFHPTRRWRFDFAWPELKLAVEIEGITFYGKNKNGSMKLGRHQTAKGLTNDCEKYGEAMLLKWDVYRCTQEFVKKGIAIDMVQKLLRLKQEGFDKA